MQPQPDPDVSAAGTGRQAGSLALVLVCLCATLALGTAGKALCADGEWADGRQYTTLCYTDIVPLLGTEQFVTGSRLPFLDPCVSRPGVNCDEYPVLQMYVMRAAAWLSPADGPVLDGSPTRSYVAFFGWNVALLWAAAVVIAVALYLMVGRRALFFALAPSLLVYGFVNWDLIAVAFATLGTLAYVERRDGWSGTLLGLGAAAKAYPALLVIPFVAGRFHDRQPVGGTRLAWSAAASWLAVNLPFILLAGSAWWTFFRFNSQRVADWDSLWYTACEAIDPARGLCERTGLVNIASLALFLASAALVWRVKARRQPDFPRWALGFPLLALFLITGKVYSPQFSLWLLPWFALVLPEVRTFLAFSVADVLVFVTRFAHFGQRDPQIDGWVDAFTLGWFQLAILLRTAVLVWCVIRWVRRTHDPLPSERRPPDPEARDELARAGAPA